MVAEIALRLPRTLELIARRDNARAPDRRAVRRLCGGASRRPLRPHRVGVTACCSRCRCSCIGTLLVLLFAQTLRLMPAGGFVPFTQDPAQHLTLLALPAIAIAKGLAAVVFRMMRATVLETLSRDYVRTARAKGLSPCARPDRGTWCATR